MRLFKLLCAGLVGGFLVSTTAVFAYDPGSAVYDTGASSGGGSSSGEYDLLAGYLYGSKAADGDTYLARTGANKWTLFAGSVATLVCDATHCTQVAGTTTGLSTLTGGFVLGADGLTGGFDIVNNVALTGDNGGVAAYEALGGSSSPWATTAAKRIGAASSYRGGLGTKNGTMTRANCSTATITIGWTDSTGTAYTQSFIEATHWARGAADNDSATALAAAITAGTGGASTPAGHTTAEVMSATAVANVVGLVEKPGKALSMTFTGDGAGTCAAEVNGADGMTCFFLPDNIGYPQALTCLRANYAANVQFVNPAGTFLGFQPLYVQATGQLQAVTYVQAGTDVLLGDDILPTVSSVATDAAPVTTVITTEEPFAVTPPTTTPTNTGGSNLVGSAANGGRRLADPADNDGMCGGAVCDFDAGNTISISVQVDGVATTCTLISAVDTVAATRHFICDGVSEAVCGANIVIAASTVSPCSLMTVVAANNVVSFARKAGLASYLGPVTVGVGGTPNVLAENGADGAFKVTNHFVVTHIEADLTAGACTAGEVRWDTGGATRELCRCNDAGTAYDCISVTTAAGPSD